MGRKKKYSDEFKATVALEALKGHKTLEELSAEYGLHPTQITRWKQELEANAAKVFIKNTQEKKELKETQKDLERAMKQIGKITMESEWLKKKLAPYS